jgi:hypothetical protein
VDDSSEDIVPVSLKGMWTGLVITEADPAEARKEMWGKFGERFQVRARISHLVDTPVLVWQFTDPRSLSVLVASILDAAEQARGRILVPSIVLVELVYLAERRRISEVAVAPTFDLLGLPRGT